MREQGLSTGLAVAAPAARAGRSRSTGPAVVSLFSGAGGLDIGLERAGWQVAVATDSSVDSMATLRESRDRAIAVRGGRLTHLARTRLLEADVADLGGLDLRPARAGAGWRPDLLAGGPPCQPWSSAGQQRGLNDPRGQLIGHLLRLVDELRPRFVLMENVRGLVTAVGAAGTPGEVLRSIQRDLNTLGYANRVATLNAADYGAAQRRVRLFLLATAEYDLPEFPEPTHDRHARHGRKPWVTLGEALSALPAPDAQDVVVPQGPRAEALRSLVPGTGIKTGGKVMNNRPGGHWGYRQDSFLADLALPARTIRAASTPDWVQLPGSEMRRLTWCESAAIQGFPGEWRFVGGTTSVFQQIGNAVQVDIAEAIGKTLLDTLRRGVSAEPPRTPPWPTELLKRVKYTEAEHRVNGDLRVRVKARRPDPPGAVTVTQ